MVRLFKWSRDFNPTDESSIALVWIRLHLLPLNFYEKSYLNVIVNLLGKFLATDLPTITHTHPLVA